MADADGIDREFRQRRCLVRELHAFFGRKRLDGLQSIDHQRVQIGRLPLQWKLMVFRQRQLTQVAHQPDQMAGLAVEIGDLGLIQRVNVIQGGAEIAFQDGQRRAQLVRDVRHQVVAQSLGVLQMSGHVIEGVCQLYHLLTAVRFDAHAKFPLADAVCGPRQIVDRRADDPGDHDAGPQPDHDGKDHEVDQTPRDFCAAGRHRSPIIERPAGSWLLGDSRRLTDIGRHHDGEELHEEDKEEHPSDHQAEANPEPIHVFPPARR